MDSVGLVVVSYNHAEYLPACLESIAQQTTLPDRVVLVDDQSSDASAELALQWAESRPGGVNVETMITPRQGPSLAFNAGVAAAGTDLGGNHCCRRPAPAEPPEAQRRAPARAQR